MKKIKIFRHGKEDKLCKMANDWLEENKVELIDAKITTRFSFPHQIVLLLIYEESKTSEYVDAVMKTADVIKNVVKNKIK